MINARKVELESLPLRVGNEWFDFDSHSRLRFESILRGWDALSASGIGFTSDNLLEWRTATNSTIAFSREQFNSLYCELCNLSALRSAAIYRKALELKSSNATIRDCMLKNWGIQLLSSA